MFCTLCNFYVYSRFFSLVRRCRQLCWIMLKILSSIYMINFIDLVVQHISVWKFSTVFTSYLLYSCFIIIIIIKDLLLNLFSKEKKLQVVMDKSRLKNKCMIQIKLLLCMVVLITFLSMSFKLALALGNETDRLALLALKDQLVDISQKLTADDLFSRNLKLNFHFIAVSRCGALTKFPTVR